MSAEPTITAPPAASEIAFPDARRLRSRDVFRLVARVWPFIRPYRRHLVYLFLATLPALFGGLIGLNLMRVFFDVVGNGGALTRGQAWMLRVPLHADRRTVLASVAVRPAPDARGREVNFSRGAARAPRVADARLSAPAGITGNLALSGLTHHDDVKTGAKVAVLGATVCAPCSVIADALTKIVMNAGEAAAPVLEHYGASALFVSAKGELHVTADWKNEVRLAA